jgi:hypothetical protein
MAQLEDSGVTFTLECDPDEYSLYQQTVRKMLVGSEGPQGRMVINVRLLPKSGEQKATQKP